MSEPLKVNSSLLYLLPFLFTLPPVKLILTVWKSMYGMVSFPKFHSSLRPVRMYFKWQLSFIDWPWNWLIYLLSFLRTQPSTAWCHHYWHTGDTGKMQQTHYNSLALHSFMSTYNFFKGKFIILKKSQKIPDKSTITPLPKSSYWVMSGSLKHR